MPNIDQTYINELARFFLYIEQEAGSATFVTRSTQLQTEAIRLHAKLKLYTESTVTCMACNPPLPMKIEDTQAHDIKFHGRVFRS